MKVNMKLPSIAVALALSTLLASAQAAEEFDLLRLSTCQDSWLDWKNDQARMARFASTIESQFLRNDQDASFVPKKPSTMLGYPIAQVFPQSVGMGVGFSVVVNAPFAQVRQTFEKQLGKPLQCSTGDGMRSCELAISEKKTAMLMANERPDSKTTLLGCYYFYQN